VVTPPADGRQHDQLDVEPEHLASVERQRDADAWTVVPASSSVTAARRAWPEPALGDRSTGAAHQE
jgi:hypothetical protein